MDFFNYRAIDLNGKEGTVTLTTMNDLANVVACAVEYSGEWPVVGGIHGTTLSTTKLLQIGAKVRGKKHLIYYLFRRNQIIERLN
jgi:hypothetical protein